MERKLGLVVSPPRAYVLRRKHHGSAPSAQQHNLRMIIADIIDFKGMRSMACHLIKDHKGNRYLLKHRLYGPAKMYFVKSRKITLFLFLLVVILLYALITSHDTAKLLQESQQQVLVLQRASNRSNVTFRDAQAERLHRIENVCKSTYVPGTVRTLLAYLPKNTTYCPTYKAASTYWIQMFRFLHGDVQHPVDRPSKISKYESHLAPMTKTQRLEYFNEREHYSVLKSFRFMMTRDPYHRLWSVYVDKFVLLDTYFWSTFTSAILAANGKRIQTKQSYPCANITFTDMLTYIVEKGKVKPEDLETHMRPMHYGCNPCIFKPHFIGKVETLTKEKTPILRKLGLEKFDDVYDFQSHVINEMSMITDFEYKLWSLPNTYRRCMSIKQLEERAIRAFVINGYLSEDTHQSLSQHLPLGMMELKQTVSTLFLNSSRTPEDVRKQRNRIRDEAYKAVPRDILERIRKLFTFDFALYGYDPKPNNIFNII